VNFTLSPQIKIVALAGLLLALAGGGVMFTLGRSQPSSEPIVVPTTHTHATVTVPSQTPARTTATTPAAKAPAAKSPSTQLAKPATKPAAPARHARRVDARLPIPLQWALTEHRIVVVSLYNPRADVDAIAVAEAHAGSADAKVGFLLVDVLDDAVAGRLTALLPGGGLLPDPGILIYRAPGTLVYRLDGFADRESVMQAAADAKAGILPPLQETATP
jgi:hypothetical protein